MLTIFYNPMYNCLISHVLCSPMNNPVCKLGEALRHHLMAAITGGRNKGSFPSGNYTLSHANDLSPASIVPASCHGCCHVMVQSFYTNIIVYRQSNI